MAEASTGIQKLVSDDTPKGAKLILGVPQLRAAHGKDLC